MAALFPLCFHGAMEKTFAGKKIPLPDNKYLRIAFGLLLMLGWCFSWLPVLGFWLLPLGLMVLSIDLPFLAPVRDKVMKWCKQASGWISKRWARLKESVS